MTENVRPAQGKINAAEVGPLAPSFLVVAEAVGVVVLGPGLGTTNQCSANAHLVEARPRVLQPSGRTKVLVSHCRRFRPEMAARRSSEDRAKGG